jgi:protein required for attachment to host cells
MTKWVVVADAGRARIFETDAKAKHVSEIADLANPEGRSSDNELAGYVGGESRPGPQSSPVEPGAREHAVDLFSKEVARYLDSARGERRYDRLYLIAEPDFLGRLRSDVTPEVGEMVADTLDKDISWFSPHDVELYVRNAVMRSPA